MNIAQASASFDLGFDFYQRQSFEEALLCFTDATNWHQNSNTNILCWRAGTYRSLGLHALAVVDMDTAIALQPHADMYNNRGYSKSLLGLHQEALDDLNTAIALDPSNIYAWYNRADIHIAVNHLPEAIECLTRAIEMCSSNDLIGLYNDRGFVYNSLKQYHHAITDFSTALARDPTYHRAYNNRGYAYLQCGEFDLALADLTKCIEQWPEYPNAFSHRAAVHIELDNLEQARLDLESAIRLMPTYSNAFSHRALLHYKLGQLDQAMSDIDRAIQHEPKNAKAWFRRAVLHQVRNERALAISDLKDAARLDSGYQDALDKVTQNIAVAMR
jgi:tetratricopeptide (TPR) repeat protein